jgi:hypothetical protein
MTEMNLKELAAKSVSELAVRHEQLRQSVEDARVELARLEIARNIAVAELEKATAELAAARQGHRDVEASLVSLANTKDSIRRQADAAWTEMQEFKKRSAWKEITSKAS